MLAIIEERIIAATPESVFQALTQQNEIARWWTDDLSVKPEVGSLAEFRFTQWGGGNLQFEIAELNSAEKVRWIFRKGPPQWAGTSVTWQLTPANNETKLLFTHDGFTQANAQTSKNWYYFLDSLKSYLETGRGTPGFPPFL